LALELGALVLARSDELGGFVLARSDGARLDDLRPEPVCSPWRLLPPRPAGDDRRAVDLLFEGLLLAIRVSK
jgi:hypothetical protein